MNSLSVSTCWYYTTVFFSLSFVLLLLLVGLVFIVFLLQGFPLNQSIRGSFLEEAAAASLFCFVCFPAGFFWAFFLAKDFLGLFNIPVAGGQKIFLLGEMSKKETLWRLEGKKKKKRFFVFPGNMCEKRIPLSKSITHFCPFPWEEDMGTGGMCTQHSKRHTRTYVVQNHNRSCVTLFFFFHRAQPPAADWLTNTHTETEFVKHKLFSFTGARRKPFPPQRKKEILFLFLGPFFGQTPDRFFFRWASTTRNPTKGYRTCVSLDSSSVGSFTFKRVRV